MKFFFKKSPSHWLNSFNNHISQYQQNLPSTSTLNEWWFAQNSLFIAFSNSVHINAVQHSHLLYPHQCHFKILHINSIIDEFLHNCFLIQCIYVHIINICYHKDVFQQQPVCPDKNTMYQQINNKYSIIISVISFFSLMCACVLKKWK